MDDDLSHRTEVSPFTLDLDVREGFVTVRFVHGGPLIREVTLHSAMLRDGRAYAGDGPKFVNVRDDVVATYFDQRRIAQATLSGGFAVSVVPGMMFAVILTWNDPGSGSMEALGAQGQYSADEQFLISETFRGPAALRFLEESGMAPNVAPAGRVEPPASSVDPGYFSEIRVAGYRGFAEEALLRLAKPTGANGSGMTIVVGSNNSGKSTFLEALHFIAMARNSYPLSFAQPRRHRDRDSVMLELVHADGRRLRVETARAGGSQAISTWLPEDSGPGNFDIHVTPSRRQFSPYFGNMGAPDRNWAMSGQEYSRTQLREAFVGRLRKVDTDPAARLQFDALLRRIVGYPLRWTIDEIATGQQFLKMIESDGSWYTSEGLGDGLVSLLFIVDALYDSEAGAVIAIDEPELSLHPQLVRRLASVLSEYSCDRQIVISTHSPLMIEWSAITNGASIARVHKRNGRSEIAQATAATLSEIARLADTRNLANPHTVGSVAREALFLDDGVILTEGQDDVAYFPRVLTSLGFEQEPNVYGWGSGGASNIPKIARLFVELGFSRIGAILDSDAQPSTAKALAELQSMAPEVMARLIPAPDIRYKPETPSRAEIVGLIGKDKRTVRPEFVEDARTAIGDVLSHVASEPESGDDAG